MAEVELSHHPQILCSIIIDPLSVRPAFANGGSLADEFRQLQCTLASQQKAEQARLAFLLIRFLRNHLSERQRNCFDCPIFTHVVKMLVLQPASTHLRSR